MDTSGCVIRDITAEDIERWAAVNQEKAGHCRDVYVYFKHEESGKGPEYARLLLDVLSRAQ